jgi:hypothetical protein
MEGMMSFDEFDRQHSKSWESWKRLHGIPSLLKLVILDKTSYDEQSVVSAVQIIRLAVDPPVNISICVFNVLSSISSDKLPKKRVAEDFPPVSRVAGEGEHEKESMRGRA